MKSLLSVLILVLLAAPATFADSTVSAVLNQDTQLFMHFNLAAMETFGDHQEDWQTFHKYVWQGEKPKSEEALRVSLVPLVTLPAGTEVKLDPLFRDEDHIYYTEVAPLDESHGLPAEVVSMFKNLNVRPVLMASHVDLLQPVELPSRLSVAFMGTLQNGFNITHSEIQEAISQAGFEPTTLSLNDRGLHIDIYGADNKAPEEANWFSRTRANRSLYMTMRDNRQISESQIRGPTVIQGFHHSEVVERYNPVSVPRIDATEFMANTIEQVKERLLKGHNVRQSN